MGDFEYSLVYYHRGHKLRPELNEFKLGIQKAQEAIDNSIGSKYYHFKMFSDSFSRILRKGGFLKRYRFTNEAFAPKSLVQHSMLPMTSFIIYF